MLDKKENIKESEREQLKLKDNNQLLSKNNAAIELKTDQQDQINNQPQILNEKINTVQIQPQIQPQIISNQLNNQPQIPNNQTTINQSIPQSNLIPVSPVMPLIANNGIQGFVPIIQPKQFGSKPVSTYCPNCRLPITTNSSRKCNCCSCCFCWYCIGCWMCIQIFRHKEITCWDYEHTCPRCGFVIGNYDAW